jgi:hypothetical protein
MLLSLTHNILLVDILVFLKNNMDRRKYYINIKLWLCDQLDEKCSRP